MALATATPIRPTEVWMILKDLKQLKKLMVIQGDISGRELARVAGYRSHTYMQRLLRGEVRTLEAEPALRIAKHFGVGVDDLFLVGTSSNAGRAHQGSGTAATHKSAA
ncbi:helix-turn-helix domain-containing protein [Oerskovia sp. NPDC060338]|uniref:helix-turn-helix domain-containing protein n=1 Tax=Oerskovia sp. NPDC060338 TaxID=3347100 RepID=UPI0036559493